MAGYKTSLSISCFLKKCINRVSPEASSCAEGSQCVALSECNLKDASFIIYPCHCGLNLYCCPSEAVRDTGITNLLSRKRELFPLNCGPQSVQIWILGLSKHANQ
ncbi:hypothetical protein NQ317_010728 [Molorchus minor]|uniref:Uncharacterized protein n=1 Tax=Molorchus minor TaxID=1323400 RepID=A0ABQ9K8V9_9CUCU|nr:hypothetical protein NQ317_010728 [Molorchus minor]